MSDLVAAFQATLTPRIEGYTVAELVVLAKLPEGHCSTLKIRKFLKHEIAGGRITAQRGQRMAIDGRPRPVPIYVPVKPKR